MSGFVTVYVTAGSADEARLIGRALVIERLAACANVIDGAHSIYMWEGKLEEAPEAVLLLKTRGSLAPEITTRVKALHSYACPCIAVWPVQGGNQDYLDWILAETRAPGEGLA